jgi:hypothetical protein
MMPHTPSKRFYVRSDSIGGGGKHAHNKKDPPMDSLTYVDDESEAWRAHVATDHYQHRGKFWNEGKHSTAKRYFLLGLIALAQATVAYSTNFLSKYFIEVTSDNVQRRMG